MGKNGLLKISYLSPAGILILMAVSIFVIESIVMVLLYYFPHESPVVHVFLDSTLLIFLLSPFLYLLLFRPLIMQIRERKKAEEGLIRERDRAGRYFDVAGVIMAVIDPEGRVLLINRKGCETLGYPESEVVGKDWFENFVPMRGRPDSMAAFAELRRDGAARASYFEGPILTSKGEERLIRWHNTLLMDGGVVTGVLASGVDITERRMMMNALKESETRYRLVHNTSFDGIIISNSNDVIIECNPAAEKIFGYGHGELRGLKIESLMPEKYRKGHEEGLKKFLETGKSKVQGRVLELEGLKKGGEAFPIELVLSSFTVEGMIHFTGTIRDITEKRRAEKERELIRAQLNQAQKMEAVGRLSSGIAHDFNNILTAVRGNAELLMEDLDSKEPMYQRLDEIIQSVRHASKLTRQLLLFGKIQPFAAVELDLNHVVKDILVMLKRLIGEDIEVETVLQDGLWSVMADEGNLEQVVLNLSVNARDAMPDGGRLRIETKNVALDEESSERVPDLGPGRFVLLTVSDTGVGIDPEILSRIFEPFFTTKGEEKGMGLGLSVVYGIVKKHRGSITVESAPGKGTTFSIYLPAFFKESAEGSGGIEGIAGGGKKAVGV